MVSTEFSIKELPVGTYSISVYSRVGTLLSEQALIGDAEISKFLIRKNDLQNVYWEEDFDGNGRVWIHGLIRDQESIDFLGLAIRANSGNVANQADLMWAVLLVYRHLKNITMLRLLPMEKVDMGFCFMIHLIITRKKS